METMRVAAQLTFDRKVISLIAEEDHLPFQKGQVVKKISRSMLAEMKRPLCVEVSTGGGKTSTKVKPILK
jgi:hypothetical protein